MTTTASIRQARYRARVKAKQKAAQAVTSTGPTTDTAPSSDPVRAFLDAIIDLSRTAVDDEEAEAFHLRHASTAADQIASLDSVQLGDNVLRWRTGRGHTDAEDAAIKAAHVARFHASRGEQGPSTTVQGRASDLVSLAWAQGELDAGRATSAALTQGLRATARIIRDRTAPDIERAYAEFTSTTNYIDALSALKGKVFDPATMTWLSEPYDSPFAEASMA